MNPASRLRTQTLDRSRELSEIIACYYITLQPPRSLRDKEGQLLGSVHVALDITERKRAEAKYRDIVENAPVGVFTREMEGKFHYVNLCLLRQLECKTEKELLDNYGLISQRWACPERNDELAALLLENRRVYGYEIESQLVDGTTKWFALYSFLDDSNRFINGFSLDITERRRAAEALQQSEARLYAILSSMNDIVFEIDLNGYFEGYHAPASKRLYAQPDHFLGKAFDEVLPEDVCVLLRQAMEST